MQLQNIADIIANPTFSESILYIRQGAGTYNVIGWEAGTEIRLAIVAVTWPLTDSEEKDLLTGVARIDDMRWFVVQLSDVSSLRLGSGVQTEGDVIEYINLRYEVKQVAAYPKFGFAQVLGGRESGQRG